MSIFFYDEASVALFHIQKKNIFPLDGNHSVIKILLIKLDPAMNNISHSGH